MIWDVQNKNKLLTKGKTQVMNHSGHEFATSKLLRPTFTVVIPHTKSNKPTEKLCPLGILPPENC